MSSNALFRSLRPRVVRHSMSRSQAESVRVAVHQAAAIAVSYREAAAFVRLAVARLDLSSSWFRRAPDTAASGHDVVTDWSVVVARDPFVAIRTRKNASIMLAVPALARDLIGASPEAMARPDPKLQFYVLVFKAARDEVPVSALGVPDATPDESEIADVKAAMGCRVLRNELTALPAHADALGVPRTDGLSRASEHVLAVIGECHRVGLHAGCEEQFATGLRSKLTRAFGSTWHVSVSAAAELPAVTRGRRAAEDGPAVDVDTVHCPSSALANAPGLLVEVTLASHVPAGTSLDAALSRVTPPRYHVLAFGTREREEQESGWGVMAQGPTPWLTVARVCLYSGVVVCGLGWLFNRYGAPVNAACAHTDASMTMPLAVAFASLLPASVLEAVLTHARFLLSPSIAATLEDAVGQMLLAAATTIAEPAPAAELDHEEGIRMRSDDGAITRPRCAAWETARADLHAGRAQALLYAGVAMVCILSMLRAIASMQSHSHTRVVVQSVARDTAARRSVAATAVNEAKDAKEAKKRR